ncbi:MAG: MFS transporter [Deltaproteobacteria bacterium]|nr:MFS transporter [Deltaproteobacteria bacterium]
MSKASEITQAERILEGQRGGFKVLDRNVKVLGFVSLLNDLSSEVTVRTLPLFLANVLGVKTGIIGFIEGVAESTATLLKITSGYLADRLGKKKALTLWGYGLSAFTKPLLYFANTWSLVLVVRFLDRVGKGIRTAPRDALIADVTPEEHRGRAFGFNKTMDKIGAVIGLLLAAWLLSFIQSGQETLTRVGYQALVLLAVIPGLVAVVILAAGVREPRPSPVEPSKPSGLEFLGWKSLDDRFKAFLGIVVLFTLGNSSDAFLMLRAQTVGFSTTEIFLLVAAFSLVFSISSFPAGILSDRLGRRRLIISGWLIYASIYFGLGVATAAWHVGILYIFYGLYYGAFHGAASALVADLVPPDRRGTAYGLFNGAIGVTVFPASLIAGLLWQWLGPTAPFFFGAALAFLSSCLLLLIPEKVESSKD